MGVGPVSRAWRWLRSHRWTIIACLVFAAFFGQTLQIRSSQIDACERGNVLRAEIKASNSILAGVIGVVLPDPFPTEEQLAALPTRDRLLLERFQDGRARLNVANARLDPSACGSVWGLL